MAETQELQRLVISLDASLTRYHNALRRASSVTDSETGKIERSFQRTNDSIRFQTANLAAQFQDIGVQLASGTSPLQIALQQGTQISHVLGTGRGGAAGAVKALGAAFLSVISPISLATIGIIALGGAAVNYIASLAGDVKSVDDQLKEHSDLIKQLRESYGDAAEGVKTYSQESSRVIEAQIRSSIVALQDQFKSLATDIADSTSRSVITWNQLATGMKEFQGVRVDSQFQAFSSAIIDFRRSVENGTPDVRAFREEVARIMSENSANSEIQRLGKQLLDMSQAASNVERGLSEARQAISSLGRVAAGEVKALEDYNKALKELSKIALPTLTDAQKARQQLESAMANSRDLHERRAALEAYDAALKRISDREAEEAAKEAQREAERNARRKQREATQGQERFSDSLQDIRDRTAALQLEFDLIGKTNFERERARTVLELENEARRNGITLTAEQRVQIEQAATAYATWVDQVERANDRMEEIREASKEFVNTLSDGLKDMIFEGKKFDEVLSNILKKLASSLFDRAINQLFLGSGLGGGGGIFGALFGGFRADGGPVRAGRGYVVGEEGPELFVPNRSGMIVPNSATRSTSAAGLNVTVAPVIDARGAAPGVSNEIVAAIRKQVLAEVVPVVQDARTRGIRV